MPEMGNILNGAVTPLFIAAQNGNDKEVDRLLQKAGIQVNQPANEGTPLFMAAQEGHEEVVKLLLKKDGILVNQVVWMGMTPLMMAAERRHGRIVEMLLRTAAIQAVGWDGWRPHRHISAPPRMPIGYAGPRTAM